MTDAQSPLAKRVKRQVTGKVRQCYAVTPLGYEKLTGIELAALPLATSDLTTQPGGVGFDANLADLMLANLHLRTANRILMRIGAFKAEGFGALKRKCAEIPWEIFFYRRQKIDIHVSCRHSRLYHSDGVAQRISEIIAERQPMMMVAPCHEWPEQKLFVRIHNNRVTLSLDSSGDPLYKRGIKTHGGPAPLRETLAAGILQLAAYNADFPLIDPMCGVGSFSLEAAMLAKNMAPGLYRHQFAFMGWPGYQPKRWNYVKKEAAQMVTQRPFPNIFASDSSKNAVGALMECITRHNLSDVAEVYDKNFFDLSPKNYTHKKGLVVLNPPYGKRLDTQSESNALLTEVALKLKSEFKDWKVAILVPEDSIKAMRSLALKRFRLIHGGITAALLYGKIT